MRTLDGCRRCPIAQKIKSHVPYRQPHAWPYPKPMSNPFPVVVVGAGIGGLSAAISLASNGIPVLVLERSSQPGGKIRQEVIHGQPIDAGPTVLTMRWVFDRLFERAGHRFDNHVRLRRADRIARHYFPDGSRLDLFPEVDRTIDAIGQFAGAREADGYRRFARHTERIYHTVREAFLESDRPTLGSTLAALAKLGPAALWHVEGHRTMWNSLGDFFTDPRLRQLFARYATYAGSSPFMSPATLNVIAHVEREGVWLADGGMHSVARACEQLALSLGVQFRYDAHVDSLILRDDRVHGVRLSTGETLNADAVVFNGDPAALASGLLGPDLRTATTTSRHPSLSALTVCAVDNVSGTDLDYHTVFFSDDYEREFIELFHQQRVPTRPTVYVCAQDRAGFGPLPRNERLFFLINAPPAQNPSSEQEIRSCLKAMTDTLSECGWQTQLPTSAIVTTPVDFDSRFPATRGSLYGPASHGMMSPLARASATCKVKGLFLAGGGAHPGAGVPMAATSGTLAARAVLRSFDSIAQSSSTATAGGTSMWSATTDNPLSS